VLTFGSGSDQFAIISPNGSTAETDVMLVSG